ncbi:MAG: alginate export family protein [Gammaproteobacteria bacterium]|nr:alginate export family protein [Gammaproteobacteria bacterium]MDH3857842.1 alginate export family protein [Gammaproteobacteria bacterium]
MRKLILIIFTSIWVCSVVSAEEGFPLEYEFLISAELSELDDLTLGDEPTEKRLEIEEYEFEFDLLYQIDDHWYAFFAGSLKDEVETIEPAGLEEEDISGFERKQIGIGVEFGDEIASDFSIGRVEFLGIGEWWLWWDEELDAVKLESSYGNFEALIGLAEEQSRENTDQDFIDPETDGIQRILASLGWEIADNQSLHFYYLDQQDDSSSFIDGETIDTDKEDEEDADLTWTGISYLGEFEDDTMGELEVELHYARVSGDETVYEFEAMPGGTSDVDGDPLKSRVRGSARGFLINWSPAQADDWSFILGRAEGEREYRQNGLQGDSEVFGELFQPELGNLVVETIGVEYEINENVEIGLLAFEYAQDRVIDELRDAAIDFELNGTSKDIGEEIDLVLTVEAFDGMELRLVVAEFKAGKAYNIEPGRNYDGETSQFWKIELEYEF